MDRFFLPPEQWDAAILIGDEARHCHRVMRKQIGDVIEVFDGRGRSAQAELVDLTKNEVRLKLGGEVAKPMPFPEITLAVGIPKGKTMDLIIQKAVELGVTEIIPLTSSQGSVKIPAAEVGKKQVKWQRVALEACKQCGQNHLPEVRPASSLHGWFALENEALKLVAALHEGSQSLRKTLSQSRVKKITCLIGPEGDFSPSEYEEAFENGYQPISLGDLVLRVETAALFLISAIRYEASGGV